MSFAGYSKYVDSRVDWLGEVPAHWTLRRLGYYFEERREKVSDADFAALSVTKSGIVLQLETAAKTDDGDNRKRVSVGDFVINSRSDRKGSSGVSELDGSVSLINTVLIPRRQVNRRFIHHVLRSAAFQEEYYRFGRGIVADLWSTSYSEMRNILLAIPSETEQFRIAAFLDRETAKIDALVEEQKRLIELLKEKRQAVISQAVTKGLGPSVAMKDSGVEWLGQVPAHWTACMLRRLIERIEQGWSPECEAQPADERGWGVLKAGCVNRGVFNPEENKTLPHSLSPVSEYEVKVGDVLMSRASGSPELVGSTALVTNTRPRLMLSDKIFRIHLEHGQSTGFFVWAMNANYMRNQIEQALSGGNGLANNLPQSVLLSLYCAVPPEEEQIEISDHLNRKVAELDQLLSQASASIELLTERRSALISAAVTGKIDVRGLVLQDEAIPA
jgi:type I restriction enzyme S subunit